MRLLHPLPTCSLACLLTVIAIVPVGPACGAAEFYVATNGKDQWSGRLAEPNADQTDGPLATLVAARDRVRVLRAGAAHPPEPVTVSIRGGVYRLEAPLVFEPIDSGSEHAPVVYQAYREEKPVLSAGRVLTGFRPNGPLWEAVIPEVRHGQWYFRQLFAAGKRRLRARSPNTGYYRIRELLPGPRDAHGKAIARDRFGFAPGDLKPWSGLNDVNLILMHSWETSIHPLKAVDVASRVVTFVAPLKEWWSIGYWEPAQRYYVENAREMLDQPGEWYLDRETGLLSYWPLPSETLEQTEIVAPHLGTLVRFDGNADEGRFVDYVTLRGLAFQHADWELSPEGNSSTQAAVNVPAAIMADGARHCAIERSEVAHVGTYGIWFRRGCKDGRIEHNRLFDLGAGGIRVGEANMARTDAAETSRILVNNNHIFDGGHVYPAGIGIWLAQSSENRIAHNDIHDLKYSGISIGWNWNDAPNHTHHNVIEFNHVHDLGQGVLSDAGLIYCLGVSPGSVIRNNVFHDMWPYSNPPFGWGIYLDATCGGYRVKNNLVYNTLSGGLMYNNGGHEHVIQNNIFALSANHALWPYSEKRPNTFRRNIVYVTQGELLSPNGERSLNDRLAARESLGLWDENLFWHTGGPDRLRFYRRTFSQWQALGLDRHSIVADPQFVDAAHHDFRLQPDSPALMLGFEPLDLSQVGLYGDPSWTHEACHASCPVIALPPPPAPPRPLTVNDDFEMTPIGRRPAHAQVSGEDAGAAIAVSDERAASGRHSLKVQDSKTLQPAWQPHLFYEPHITAGVVHQSFDAWLGTGSQFFSEWRDTTAYPSNIGPNVQLDGEGNVSTGSRRLMTVPAGKWVRVELEARIGTDAPRTFTLRVTPSGGPVRTFDNQGFEGGLMCLVKCRHTRR